MIWGKERMKKGMYRKSIFFLVIGLILVFGVPAVLSESYSYSKNYEYVTYTYPEKTDYDYYEYNSYEKYDYSNSYYSCYDYYKYNKYEYVLQNYLYRILERYPVLEKLFDRFF